MAKRLLICVLTCTLLFSTFSTPASAASNNPFIIETGGLLGGILSIVSALGGGTLLDQVPGTNIYLVNLLNIPVVTPLLESLLGIVFMEPDERVTAPAAGKEGLLTIPTQTAWNWYKTQPELVRINAVSAQAYSQGKGVVVADLNSLVDYSHPALTGHLTGGYDFVTSRAGYQSTLDQSSSSFLDQSSSGFLDQSSSSFLDQSSSGFLDQSSSSFLDQNYASFVPLSQITSTDANPAYGHGTLCAGVIAAVAPGSMIMPLRVFDSNGQTDAFSVTKAIYYAVR